MRLWLVVVCLACAGEANAQRLFHDKDRDAVAQKAAEAAKQVTSGTLFETMLRNVDVQAKLEIDTTMAYVQEQMRAQINAFERWHDTQGVACEKSVECALLVLKRKHEGALATVSQDQLDERLSNIKERQERLKTELEALQEASKSQDPAVVQVFAALQDPGKDLLDQANKIAAVGGKSTAGVTNALDAIANGLDQIGALFAALKGIWAGQRAVSVDPRSLRPPQQQTDLQLLAIEKNSFEVLARINAREQLETGSAVDIVVSALNGLERLPTPRPECGAASPPESIEASLKTAADCHDRPRLVGLLLTLHKASAAVAQMDAAARLADLRRSDEERRYSIRRSLVNARTYDQTIQAAVERLGLYWKSGIKPGELVQFAFYLANTIAVPAIAIKQD